MLKDPRAQPVRYYYRGGSAARARAPPAQARVPRGAARQGHGTRVTPHIGPQPAAAARALLAAARGQRVVDPNLRAGLPGSERRVALVLPLIDACDLVIGGEDELGELVGSGGGREGLARRCAARGPREVVVRGDSGLGALGPDGAWTDVEAPRQEAVDAVGAGDAFNAGYLAVRLRGGSTASALEAGARCGAAVALRLGDTAGFPRSLDPA
jgi:2-dehydro-3-deoxygluconokinase